MATVLDNPLRGPLAPRDAGPDPRSFHRRLPAYRPSPLVDAPGLAADIGVGGLWIKDESSRLGLPSFKILGASWATYRLVIELLGREPEWASVEDLRRQLEPLGPRTLVAATDGNHGRAVAHMARLFAWDAVVLVPLGTASARIDAIAGEGAVVEVIDGTYDDAVAASAALADEAHLVVSDTSWPGYERVPAWVVDGYETIFDEADEQGAAPDAVVVQMGVGALTAAAVRHYAPGAAVHVVEPETADCGLRSAAAGRPTAAPGPHPSIMVGLNCGEVSPIAWPTVAAGVATFVSVPDAAAERAMNDLAGAGVVAGETGAAGIAGLRALVEASRIASDARVLVICTEGATDPVAYERITGRPPPDA